MAEMAERMEDDMMEYCLKASVLEVWSGHRTTNVSGMCHVLFESSGLDGFKYYWQGHTDESDMPSAMPI